MKVRELVSRVAQPTPAELQRGSPSPRPGGTNGVFADELRHAEHRQSIKPVSLSRHAEQRIEERGIDVNAERMERIAFAVSELQEKGAINALLLGKNDAFVVNVPNRMVVTAVGADDMKERAFTNIDSAYLLDEGGE